MTKDLFWWRVLPAEKSYLKGHISGSTLSQLQCTQNRAGGCCKAPSISREMGLQAAESLWTGFRSHPDSQGTKPLQIAEADNYRVRERCQQELQRGTLVCFLPSEADAHNKLAFDVEVVGTQHKLQR